MKGTAGLDQTCISKVSLITYWWPAEQIIHIHGVATGVNSSLKYLYALIWHPSIYIPWCLHHDDAAIRPTTARRASAGGTTTSSPWWTSPPSRWCRLPPLVVDGRRRRWCWAWKSGCETRSCSPSAPAPPRHLQHRHRHKCDRPEQGSCPNDSSPSSC